MSCDRGSVLIEAYCSFPITLHLTQSLPILSIQNIDKQNQWGTWKAGVSLLNTGIRHPGSVMKNVIPIVMAGVIGIYGLIIAVILGGNIPSPTVGTGENIYSIYTGMAHVSLLRELVFLFYVAKLFF